MVTPQIKRLVDNQAAAFTWLRPDNPHTGQPVIEPIHRPNVNGYAFRALATKGDPWRCVAMRDFSNESTARAAAQNLRDNIVGELCSIRTRDGTIYDRQMCLSVVEKEVKTVIKTVGGITDSTFFTGVGEPGLPAMVVFEIEFVHAGPVTT